MIQLYRHIEILLLDNDCVIVPGLGGFMAHHTAAKYYEDTQTYVPPIRQLGFNGQLRINDSLLAQSYIEAYDISYPEAVRRIEDEVAEMMQTLQSKGQCELDDIGILRTSIDGHLEFEPCEAGILTPSLYGLDSVDIKPIAQRSTGKLDTQMAKSPVSVLTEQPQPESRLVMTHGDDTGTGDTEDTEEKTIRIKVGTLRRVALVAAVVITLFICVLPLGKTTQPELTRSYIDTGVLFNILPEALRSTQDKPERYGLNDSGAIEQETIKAEDNTKTAETEPDQTTTQADGRMLGGEHGGSQHILYHRLGKQSDTDQWRGLCPKPEGSRVGQGRGDRTEQWGESDIRTFHNSGRGKAVSGRAQGRGISIQRGMGDGGQMRDNAHQENTPRHLRRDKCP